MPRIKSILLLACLLCYTSAQAIWLSPDPLLDKYPHISPYAYCNWNPVKYVDPDGRIIIFAPGTTPTQKKQFWQTVRYLDSNNCGGRFGQLKNSKYTYTINMNAKKSQFLPNKQTINHARTAKFIQALVVLQLIDSNRDSKQLMAWIESVTTYSAGETRVFNQALRAVKIDDREFERLKEQIAQIIAK